jgi:hypothetical protein
LTQLREMVGSQQPKTAFLSLLLLFLLTVLNIYNQSPSITWVTLICKDFAGGDSKKEDGGVVEGDFVRQDGRGV